MMKLQFSLCLILFSLLSCKKEKTTISESPVSPTTKEIPSDFLAFYDQFHNDSIFQMNHIVFPVKSSLASVQYAKQDWRLHKPFNSQGGNFVRSFNNIGGIIIEFIKEKNGFVTIERRFSKMDDDYHLIYYNIKSEFDQVEEQ